MDFLRRPNIAGLGQLSTVASIDFRIVRRPGSQPVDIPVVHTKGGGNENRVMDFPIGRAALASSLDIGACYMLAAALNFSRNNQQSFQLIGDRRSLRILLYIEDELLVPSEMMSSDSTVDGLTKEAVVLRGYIRCD